MGWVQRGGYSRPEGQKVGEAARSLFWTGSESSLESASSEVSLIGGGVVKREFRLIKTPNREIDEDEGPLCSIEFLHGGGERICGGIVASGEIFCTKKQEIALQHHMFVRRDWMKSYQEERIGFG